MELAEERRKGLVCCGSQLGFINLHLKVIVSIFLEEFKFHSCWGTLSDSSENDPSSKNMGLSPDFLLRVVVLEALDARCKDIHPTDIVDVIPLSLSSLEEDLEWLVKVHQEESDAISSAFFVTRVQLAELLRPCLCRQVEGRDLFTGEWVLQIWREVELAGLNVFG